VLKVSQLSFFVAGKNLGSTDKRNSSMIPGHHKEAADSQGKISPADMRKNATKNPFISITKREKSQKFC
jgi:hypothetical protein